MGNETVSKAFLVMRKTATQWYVQMEFQEFLASSFVGGRESYARQSHPGPVSGGDALLHSALAAASG